MTKSAAIPPNERILVVNDMEGPCEIICAILGAAGYQCKTATNGIKALTLLDSGEEFDLLLSNFMMPQMDGMELLERTRERFSDIPFVFESGCNDLSVFLAAMRNGAYDYLQTPFEREQLLAVARRAIEYRRLKLENRKYKTELESLVERSYDITLEGIGDALALKDFETEGHSKRVALFAIVIARAMGLPRDQIALIARGAYLHDIGKLAIPDAILRKPSPLSSEEVTWMRKHCYHGYQMLKKIPFLKDVAEIVYAHQEHFDGSGYPRKLKGEQIPLGARLVAVGNALDAMTSDRPYRAAQSVDAAREEIRRWAGRQFDPDVVRTFLSMPENTWEVLRRDIDLP